MKRRRSIARQLAERFGGRWTYGGRDWRDDLGRFAWRVAMPIWGDHDVVVSSGQVNVHDRDGFYLGTIEVGDLWKPLRALRPDPATARPLRGRRRP